MENVKKTDLKSLKGNMIITGLNDDNKNTLLKEYIKEHNFSHDKIYFNNSIYDDIVSNETMINGLSNDGIKRIYHEIKNNKLECVLLIIDYDKFPNDLLERLWIDSSKYNITFIITMKKMENLNNNIKNNIDYVLSFYDKYVFNQAKLWKLVFNDILSYDEFEVVFNACTKDENNVIIKDNKEKKIYYYSDKVDPSWYNYLMSFIF